MAKRTTLAEIHKLAREKLGFDKLRTDQEAVVSQLLQNRDVLAVMPTGGGKSAIYQLAGMVIGGSTIVVSPLIALQADQVLHIEGSDLPPGALLTNGSNKFCLVPPARSQSGIPRGWIEPH